MRPKLYAARLAEQTPEKELDFCRCSARGFHRGANDDQPGFPDPWLAIAVKDAKERNKNWPRRFVADLAAVPHGRARFIPAGLDMLSDLAKHYRYLYTWRDDQ